ncbi:hypothetical protein B0H11DRAFT_1868620 [Mycena galericulata]|nr:hypothetical protein B0H11DRAFT_1868620 [Mycena galericulata]
MGRLSALLLGTASERDPSHDSAAAKLWSVYVGEAEKYDRALVESWKRDMEGMLIFAGLFSASLTAFLIESYTTLTQDSGERTILLLAQISYQLSAAANGTNHTMTPSTPSFTPPVTSLVCNGFWFTSLGLSLTCALIATLLEQWARDFLHKADMRSSPTTRARVFSYLYYGLKRFNMHAVVEIVPLLLHASLLLFFIGLVAFLIPVNIAMTVVASTLLALVAGIYIWLTILPLFSLDCPYKTPLSRLIWNIVSSFVVRDPSSINQEQLEQDSPTMVESMLRTATEFSDERSARDKRALVWTMKSLGDDEELAPFIEAIPDVLWGPYSRRHVYDGHIDHLIRAPDTLLLDRLDAFFENSRRGVFTEEEKLRRQTIFFKALWAIMSVYDATGSSKQPPRFHDSLSYSMASTHPHIKPYKCSALALLRWHTNWEGNVGTMGMLEDLQQCQRDVGMGKMPNISAVWTALSKERGFNHHDIANEMYKYMQAPNISEAARLIPQWFVKIQARHAGAPLDTLIHYLENSASLDSPPYRYEETVEYIRPRTILRSSATRRSLESALEGIIHGLMDRFNSAEHGDHWRDEIVRKLFLCWWPDAGTDEPIALPASVIHYLNFRNSVDALWRFSETLNQHRWACIARTLLDGPSVTHPSSSRFPKDPDRIQTLKALWNLLHAGQYLMEHEDEPIIPSLQVVTNTLDVLLAMPISPEAMSATALVKDKLLNRLHRLTSDGSTGDHLLQLHHPLLPTETAVTVPIEYLARQLNHGQGGEFRRVMLDRIEEARIIVISEYLEWCSSQVSPFRPLETFSTLRSIMCRTAVHETHQIRFAEAVRRLLIAPLADVVLGGLLDKIIKKTLEVYTPIARLTRPHIVGLQLYPWLNNPSARQIIKVAFTEYKNRLTVLDPPLPDLLSDLEEIINSLDSMHPPPGQIPENIVLNGEAPEGEAAGQPADGSEIVESVAS